MTSNEMSAHNFPFVATFSLKAKKKKKEGTVSPRRGGWMIFASKTVPLALPRSPFGRVGRADWSRFNKTAGFASHIQYCTLEFSSKVFLTTNSIIKIC